MSRSLGPMLCFQRRCQQLQFLVPRARARAHAWTDGKCCSHSGAIGDGIADLMEAGIVDNRHKA
jgi:hypothetical protein